MEKYKCTKCGYTFKKNIEKCPKCGEQLYYCKHKGCNKQLFDPKMKYCATHKTYHKEIGKKVLKYSLIAVASVPLIIFTAGKVNPVKAIKK